MLRKQTHMIFINYRRPASLSLFMSRSRNISRFTYSGRAGLSGSGAGRCLAATQHMVSGDSWRRRVKHRTCNARPP